MSPTDSDIPENFQVVHLDLSPDFGDQGPGDTGGPAGDRYTLLLPIGPDGRILEAQARRHPGYCRVSRLDADGGVVRGLMRPETGGTWRLDFGEAEAPSGHIGKESFAPGGSVTIVGDEGPRTYRVVALQPL
jgi:hypothetical protein